MTGEWKQRLKQRLKPAYFGGRRAVTQALFGYDANAFGAALGALGIATGDTLLVHSAFLRDSGYTGTAGEIVDALIARVGDDGNVVMMSMPYSGSSERYVATAPVFDVARSPTALGMIAETFRRRAGVLRSANPLHPITAHGPLADWLTADHDQSAYSCGRGSPFERFLSLDGKLLFYDASYSSMTFMHYVEDHFRARLPVALYDDEPVALTIRDRDGRERRLRQYFFSREARERRHFAPVEQALRDSGALREATVGRSALLCVGARDVVAAAGALLDAGTGFYH